MKYKKSQVATDTPIIISIVAFQAFIILALGFINIHAENSSGTTLNNSDITTSNINGIGFLDFLDNIIVNIKELGWGSSLLFTPIVVAIVYIIAKLIRGGG